MGDHLAAIRRSVAIGGWWLKWRGLSHLTNDATAIGRSRREHTIFKKADPLHNAGDLARKSNIQVSVLAAGHNFEDMVRKPGRKLARGDENTLLFFAPAPELFKTLLIFLAPPLYRTLQCYQRLT
jgi:hypothetical protein